MFCSIATGRAAGILSENISILNWTFEEAKTSMPNIFYTATEALSEKVPHIRRINPEEGWYPLSFNPTSEENSFCSIASLKDRQGSMISSYIESVMFSQYLQVYGSRYTAASIISLEGSSIKRRLSGLNLTASIFTVSEGLSISSNTSGHFLMAVINTLSVGQRIPCTAYAESCTAANWTLSDKLLKLSMTEGSFFFAYRNNASESC